MKKLTTQQKACIAILAIALVALLVDRVFLGGASGPQSAEAQLTSPRSLNTLLPKPLQAVVDERAGRPPLIEKLQDLTKSQNLSLAEMSEAFRLSDEWRAEVGSVSVRLQGRSLTPAQRFVRTHQLEVVMVGGARSRAVVNNKPLQLNQQIDGFTLVSVTHNSAVFVCENQRVELLMKKPQD